MLTLAIGVLTGIGTAILWHLVRDQGHSVYGVKDRHVQDIVKGIVGGLTSIKPLNMIDSGPTHQQVFTGGTVFSWFDDVPGLASLPRNVRSFVIWREWKRRHAANVLVSLLRLHGYEASIEEPLQGIPPGTFLLVRSNAFLDCGIAFRPHWMRMAFLEARAKKH